DYLIKTGFCEVERKSELRRGEEGMATVLDKVIGITNLYHSSGRAITPSYKTGPMTNQSETKEDGNPGGHLQTISDMRRDQLISPISCFYSQLEHLIGVI
ncbi:hypothetical protein J6590_102960, partial [Homalodisca vitripennis]